MGQGGQLARSRPLALLPAELSHRQTKPKHETNNACVGLFIEITFNANASQGRGRTETSSSERGGFAQRPGARGAVVGQRGRAVRRLVPAPSGRAKAPKWPQNGCLCMGKGPVRGCGGGMGAHRPCSSSRKLNEKKRTPTPPTHPKPQMQNAFCKTQICTCPRPQKDGSPSIQPWTRHHRVFRSRSRGETAVPPPQPAPAPAGEGMGTGITRLPLTKESLQCPETKNTTKQINKKKKKIKTKKQNTVITS